MQASYDGEKVNFFGFLPTTIRHMFLVMYPAKGGAILYYTLRPDTIPDVIPRLFVYPSELHKGERVNQ